MNFVDEHFNRDSFSKTFVSTEPVNNRKDMVKRQIANNLIVNDDDKEDEVFVRVKRSPDPNPQPSGGRGGGSSYRVVYYGGFGGYNVGESGNGDSLSTGAVVGILLGIGVGFPALCIFIVIIINSLFIHSCREARNCTSKSEN